MGSVPVKNDQERLLAFISGNEVSKDGTYVLNYCTKYLARENTDERHNHGQFAAGDPRGRISESWRFPIVNGHYNADDPPESYRWNEVTFIFHVEKDQQFPTNVAVIGTFAPLYRAIPLQQVLDTPFFAVTVLVPKGEIHAYQFLIDGQRQLDPVNPQRMTLDNGRTWSRFFTYGCTQRVSFEPWEIDILSRFTDHILPFRTADGQRFLEQYYQSLDRQTREERYPGSYRFDESVGVASFIDKLVAREENHRFLDYKICLSEINRLLRLRNPFVEPRQMSKELYIELYEQMASDNVPGWDTSRYGSPRFFLQLLRRHTLTGAFSHPKYCGNSGATGWAYLSERYRDPKTGETLFNWRQNMEQPLGTNQHYRG